MLILVNLFGLLLCRFAPKQKHYVFALSVDDLNDFTGELLPAAFCMRVGLTIDHSERGVE